MRAPSLVGLALVAAVAPLAAQRRPVAPPTAYVVPAAPSAPHLPPLPDSSGWGTHILALARGPDGALWVGTYGEGIYVLRPGARQWQNLRHIRGDSTGRSISWDFVHAFAFGEGREVWYGTVGNGWGLSRDGGRTWRSWEFGQLGPRWQYVAPNGIVTRGDTVYIATADGILVTANDGATWDSILDAGQGALPSRYVLTIAPGRTTGLWVSTLWGVGEWRPDNGYRATHPSPTPALGPRVRAIFVIRAPGAVVPAVLGSERCAGGMRPRRRQEPATWQCMGVLMREAPPGGRAVRALAGCDGVLCAGATNTGAIFGARMGLAVQAPQGSARSRDVYAVLPPPPGEPGDTLFGTACGFLGQQPGACTAAGDTVGVSTPAPPRHTWFARPIALTDQPYIDQTYRYGSTMGGNFQQHQGIEFNNPVGTPVLAIDAGIVVHAGPAEQGSLTVVIRHDSTLALNEGGRPPRWFVFSTYYHNSRLLVSVGERVQRGQRIALVGSTGRATNAHLHLEVHAGPTDSAGAIADLEVRYPPYTRNPELWIEPLPGTGVVAGQVWDVQGRTVPRARVYGIVKPEPQETPFSYAETYGEQAHSDPSYGEHFAVSDVPPGEY
ncbi:MAG: peptidoglycan DD-metalloendopeptidase family protein, partial [Gemmatimonadetes bacterium]|nr:peptidoglycan DD-metalloendopeptidase family protein [Gemmatimonadota bacterium]